MASRMRPTGPASQLRAESQINGIRDAHDDAGTVPGETLDLPADSLPTTTPSNIVRSSSDSRVQLKSIVVVAIYARCQVDTGMVAHGGASQNGYQ